MEDKRIEEDNDRLVDRALRNYRERTRECRRRDMKLILNYFYEKFGKKHLLSYSFSEIEEFKDWIQNKKVGLERKKRLLLTLKKTIMEGLKEAGANGDFQLIAFWKYTLEEKNFTESGKKKEIKYIEPEEIKEFLNTLKRTDLENYFLFGILIYSGCRLSGLINLQYNNINFDQGYFITQEKPTKVSSGLNTYFLPMFFVKELKLFCMQNNITNADKLCTVSDKQIRTRLRKTLKKPNWHPHLFRHSFRTQLHLKGCPEVEAEFLLNHAVRGILQVYLQQLKNMKHLREIYDKFFPY